MRDFSRAALLSAALALCGTAVTGQTPSAEAILILRASQGTERITLAGEIVDFDGQFYTIDTIYGVLTVPVDQAECLGRSCPDPDAFIPTLRVAAPHDPGRALMPSLLEGWAEAQNLVMVQAAALPDAGANTVVYYLAEPDTADVRMEIRIDFGSDDAGLIALLDGEADMALSLHQWRDAGIQSLLVALDAYVPVVAPDSDLRDLDLARGLVFALRRADLADGEPGAGARALHATAEGGEFPPVLRDRLLPLSDNLPLGGFTLHAESAALVTALHADPEALGLIRWSRVEDLRVLPLSGNCGRQIVATTNSIRAEDWPLSIPVQLYLLPDRFALRLRSFVRYLYSDAALARVRQAGLIALSPSPQGLDRQGARIVDSILAAGTDVSLTDLQRMARRLQGTERLSYTFRFQEGSTELDTFSEGALLHLAEAIRSGRLGDRPLLLSGFTDSAGSSAANRRLSVDRACAVADALRRAFPYGMDDRVSLEVLGFGEAMPLACDDSALGRHANRRVEVWLR